MIDRTPQQFSNWYTHCMLSKIIEYGLLIGGFLFLFGLSQYFTAEKGEKWHPGMGYPWLKVISDNLSGKLMYWGLGLFSISCILIIIFNQLGWS